MKTYFMRNLWILIFLALSSSLIAQRLDKPEMYIGVNLGATESMIGFTPTIDQGFLQGYNGGVVFRYVGDKYAGVQAELNFSQHGWKEKSGLYTRQLNYIELPFLTHFYLGNKGRVFFNLGPKISYLISEKELINNTDATTDNETQLTLHKTLIQNPFDYGLCGGLGFLFKINKRIAKEFSNCSGGYIFKTDPPSPKWGKLNCKQIIKTFSYYYFSHFILVSC